MNTRASVQLPRLPAKQQGMSLLEVLIAVLVLAIGLLGIAALQATALRNSQGSLERNQAVIATYTIADAMRANPTVAATGGYAQAQVCTPPALAASATLRDRDINAWITDIQAVLGTTGLTSTCGTIVYDPGAAAVGDESYRITVQWDDSRATGGSSTYSMTTVVQI